MPEGGAGTGNPLVDLLIVLVLILIGGLFAAAEIALITVRRTRLEQLAEEGKRGARTARRLVDEPQRFLATIQVAITFLDHGREAYRRRIRKFRFYLRCHQ